MFRRRFHHTIIVESDDHICDWKRRSKHGIANRAIVAILRRRWLPWGDVWDLALSIKMTNAAKNACLKLHKQLLIMGVLINYVTLICTSMSWPFKNFPTRTNSFRRDSQEFISNWWRNSRTVPQNVYANWRFALPETNKQSQEARKQSNSILARAWDVGIFSQFVAWSRGRSAKTPARHCERCFVAIPVDLWMKSFLNVARGQHVNGGDLIFVNENKNN